MKIWTINRFNTVPKPLKLTEMTCEYVERSTSWFDDDIDPLCPTEEFISSNLRLRSLSKTSPLDP